MEMGVIHHVRLKLDGVVVVGVLLLQTHVLKYVEMDLIKVCGNVMTEIMIMMMDVILNDILNQAGTA